MYFLNSISNGVCKESVMNSQTWIIYIADELWNKYKYKSAYFKYKDKLHIRGKNNYIVFDWAENKDYWQNKQLDCWKPWGKRLVRKVVVRRKAYETVKLFSQKTSVF